MSTTKYLLKFWISRFAHLEHFVTISPIPVSVLALLVRASEQLPTNSFPAFGGSVESEMYGTKKNSLQLGAAAYAPECINGFSLADVVRL